MTTRCAEFASLRFGKRARPLGDARSVTAIRARLSTFLRSWKAFVVVVDESRATLPLGNRSISPSERHPSLCTSGRRFAQNLTFRFPIRQTLRQADVVRPYFRLVRSFSVVSSLNNHALAIFQSRLTVSGEIFRTSAVSSTLNPPK